MSYVNIYLPPLNELKEQIQNNPKILDYYSKFMGFSGPSDSVDYLAKKLEEYSQKN